MLFLALSKNPVDLKPFKKLRFNTSEATLGKFCLSIAFDPKHVSCFETESKIVLVESMRKIRKEKIGELFGFKTEQLAKNFIYSLIVADLKDEKIRTRRPFLSNRTFYYNVDSEGTTLYCSTHIKLLKEAGLKIEEDRHAVAEYFLFGFVMDPTTLYRDIKKMPTGQSLDISCAEDKFSLRFIDFSYPQKKRTCIDENEVSDRIIELLKSVVAPLKPLKGRIAVSFSGGLDSSILAQFLKDEVGSIRTYSVSYPFENLEKSPEKEYAISGGKALHLAHVHLEISPRQYLHDIIDTIAEGEGPVSYYLQTPLFCHMLKRPPNNEQIIVFGDAADVLFGSRDSQTLYYLTEAIHSEIIVERLHALIFRLAKNPSMNKLLRLLSRLVGKESGGLKLAMAKTDDNIFNPDHFLWQRRLLISDEGWVAERFSVSPQDIINRRKKALESYQQYSIHDLMAICDFLEWHEMSLESKFGQRYDREALFPYCYDLLVDYSFQLPWKFKVKEKKYALRLMSRKIGIPEFMITRPKRGFGTKAEYWAVPGKIFEPFVTLCEGVFNREEFHNVQSSDSKKCRIFWFMINYALWKEIFIKGTLPSRLHEKLDQILDAHKQYSTK